MSSIKSAVIVGASSGIGLEIARQLAAQGAKVAAIARRGDKLAALQAEFPDRIFPFEHDVQNIDDVETTFEKATNAIGGLDVLVYAAGVMPVVGETEFDIEKDSLMIRVNFLGAVAWLSVGAERLSNTGHGTLVGIGSVAGDRGRHAQPTYNATKAALATYLEALRNRVSKKGVKVLTVKPGPVSTEMTAHLSQKGFMSAQDAAEKIIGMMNSNGEKYLSWKHRVAFYIIKRIPSPIFRKLKI